MATGGKRMAQKILFNLMQVLVVMAFAPLVKGVLGRLKERIQSKRGPTFFSRTLIYGSSFTKTKSYPSTLLGFFASPRT